MNVILFDDHYRTNLLPLTFTRTAAQIRIGIDTIAEKWERFIEEEVSFLTEDYLAEKFGVCYSSTNYYINARFIPSNELLDVIKNLKENEVLFQNDEVIAFISDKELTYQEIQEIEGNKMCDIESICIQNWYDIFQKNAMVLNIDFESITKDRKSQKLSKTNSVIGDEKLIFLEEGAKVEAATLNTENGPIYVGYDAEIMEGSNVRGGLALCEHATLKMATKIYGATTIGPHCKVGGEVNNSVILGYSNKGHDGFLGNSVIGEWCNLGADTNNSNLKNNYGEVSCWNYLENNFVNTSLQFCGIVMGDHSKSGINTMFNTGTVIGICANIFGGGFPFKFIPSYSWGGSDGMEEFRLEKAMEVAERMMERRSIELDDVEKAILQYIFDHSAEERERL